MSNLSLVNDALSLIAVLPAGQSASAEDGELALRVASELVDEWADDGIVVSWAPNPTLDGECSLVGVELSAVKNVLAVRLCPHFGRDPSGTLTALAASAYRRLQRIQLVRGLESIDRTMPVAEGYVGFRDITSDGF